jgi:hypothetical protein
VGPEDGGVAVTVEGERPGQALEQHAAQRVDVGGGTDRLAGDLLGGDVVDRADELARGRQPRLGRGPLGEPEVGQVHVVQVVAVGVDHDQDVARLDVPVDQAPAVGDVQRPADLPEDRQRLPGVEAALLGQHALEVGPVDVAHGDVEHALGVAGLVDRQHVGMVDGGGELRLADEPLPEPLVLGQLGRDDLERDPPAEAEVLGPVHHGHPAPPDERLNAVAGDLGPRRDECAH